MNVPFIEARVRVALELVLAGDERDLERLLALGRDVVETSTPPGPVRWKLCALDWSSTTSV